VVEVVERRELLASGTGVIAGTAFIDGNSDDTLDPNDAYLPGATVELFQAGNPTPIATQVTDADGGYVFQGLAPGSYVITETPPANYQVTGTQVLAQVQPGSSVAGNQIQVTIPAVPAWVNYNGVNPGNYQVLHNLVNGTPLTDSVGQLRISVGTASGQTDINPGFLTECLNDLDHLSFGGGEKFQVDFDPITDASNGTTTIPADRAGRIAFLYNHFGNASLNDIQAPALQLAIWELLYDTGPTANFSTGNFQVVGPVPPFTDQATLSQVLAQATAYFNKSAGKSEAVILLNATPFQAPGQTTGAQSMIATGSYNFANKPTPTPASLSGFVYCDANDDGQFDTGDMALPAALVTLTGTDQNGKPVSLNTTTDATGAYHFANLVPGVYTINVPSAPPGTVPGTSSQGTPGNGTDGVDEISDITLDAGVVGVNNDFGFHGQVVNQTGLSLLGIHHQPSQIVLQFDGPLNTVAAQDPANYTLVGLGKDQRLGTADDHRYSIVAATYNSANQTVTLIPNSHLNIHYHYVLRYTLAPLSSCAPPVTSTTVFGRTAVPYFTVHGRKVPNPPLTRAQARHDAAIVQHTLALLNEDPGPI
jgi:hypothetical protein